MRPREPLPRGPFDLIVIGGGINGAAIARDALLRRMSVCLVEKGDFASGTSSRTSKMVHGGIRYLEQGRLGLVFESLRERALLLRLAPHLVHPQPFAIPIYRGAGRGRRWIRAGLLLYDLLAIGRRPGRARMVGPEQAAGLVPGLLTRDLEAAGIYYDAVMDDARLCLANIIDARDRARPGNFYCRNYCEVIERRPTSPILVRVRDKCLGEEFELTAHNVVRSVGPWTDLDRGDAEPIMVPSKGIHAVLPPRSTLLDGLAGADSHGLLLTHSRDGRVFFVIPWQGHTLVGTTETPFSGSPDGLKVEAGEVEYLVREFSRVFPGVHLGPADLLGVFAGVRPLARTRGLWSDVHRASRRHRILDDGHGTITVAGGKYTTFRAVAEEVVDRLRAGSPCITTRTSFPGGERGPWDAYRAGEGRGWVERFGEETVHALFGRHGARLSRVLEPALQDPALAEPVAPGVLRAEIRLSVREEWVTYPEDFLLRRTQLRFTPGGGREVYPIIEEEIRSAAGPTAPRDLDAARERYFANLEDEDRLRGVLATAAATAR